MASMYRERVVSVWFGTESPQDKQDMDVLEDMCGIEYYNLDYNEGYASDDWQPIEVAALLRPLSYSASYIDAAVTRAKELGIEKAIWSVVQYDFAYDPAQVVRPIASDPKFIGYFPYVPDPLPDWAR